MSAGGCEMKQSSSGSLRLTARQKDVVALLAEGRN